MKLESERMNDLQCHIRCARLVHSGFWLMHMFVRLGSAFWIFRRINLILENIGAAVVESIGSGSVCTSLCCFLFLGLVFVSEYFFFPAEEWNNKISKYKVGPGYRLLSSFCRKQPNILYSPRHAFISLWNGYFPIEMHMKGERTSKTGDVHGQMPTHGGLFSSAGQTYIHVIKLVVALWRSG